MDNKNLNEASLLLANENLRKFQSKNFINDLIAKYKKEKESFMYSLANLTEDFIDDLEKIKGVIDE